MSEERDTFDVVVLGAGPAGEVAAGRLAQHGLEVAIVESDLVGGECSFYACMPSKALLRPAEVLAEARRVPGAAQAATGALDVQAVLDRRDEVVHDLDDSAQLPWLEARGVTLVRGHGRLAGPRQVEVDGRRLSARRAVILAMGSAAAMPPIPGLADARPWTNREGTTAKRVPASLVVLGGGPVGCELATAYRSLGVEVTLVEGEPRLLPREEPFAGEQVAESLRARGARVLLGRKMTAVRRQGELLRAELDDGIELEAEEILVAVGRRPLTDDVGLETIGLEPGRHVAVDDTLRVPGHDWLYAIGDVNGRILLTHMGKYQAHVASENIEGRPARLESDGIRSPRVTFTDPQVAAVGLTEQAATEAGLRVRAVDAASDGTAGASFYGRGTGGTSRIVVDEDRGVIVGATFTGAEVGDWLQAASIAVAGEVPVGRLWDAVPAFPTRSEVWLRLLEGYERETSPEAAHAGAILAA